MSIADLSTHQNFVSDRLRTTRSRMVAAAGIIDVRVQILSGPQAGADRTLRIAEMSIGGGADNDLIILDPTAKPNQGVVHFKRSVFGTLADVTALDGPVRVGDKMVRQGETLEAVKLPVQLDIGKSTIEISGENQRGSKPSRVHRGQFFSFDPILTASVLALLVLMVWSVFSAYFLNNDQRHAVTVNAPVVQQVAKQAPARDWPAELAAEVGVVGLSDNLRVDFNGAGLLQVSGLLPNGQDQALRDVQAWYDSQPSAPTVIWDIKRDTALTEVPNIAMVRFTEPAQVLLANGMTVQVGETLVNDWTLNEMTATELVLSRGAERQSLFYEELMQ